MIKKSILVTILLLGIYLIVKGIYFKDVRLGQANWQISQDLAQNYMYSDEDYEIVLTGSSVTFGISQFDSDSTTNLSFSGENALTGLKVINYRGKILNKYPKYVLIEVPTLRVIDEPFSQGILYNPFMIYTRRYLTIFRDGQQPLPWLSARVQRMNIIPYRIEVGFDYLDPILVGLKEKYIANNQENNKQTPKNENIFQNLDTSSNNGLLDPKSYQDLEEKITFEIDPLIDKGVTPIFFYPPNQRAENTPLLKSVTDILDRHYPKDRYFRVINHPDSAFINSGDRIHLPDSRFQNYLKQQVDSFLIEKRH